MLERVVLIGAACVTNGAAAKTSQAALQRSMDDLRIMVSAS